MTYNSFAKVNIYLKIVGTKDNYHLISSRFMIVNSLYDIIKFEKKEKMNDQFELIGKFSCKTEQNIIYKAYKKLLLIDNISKKVKDFFNTYKVTVVKNIPEFAGLGGGSSNAATFLTMCNNILNLNLKKEKLNFISNSLGSDVTFFLEGFNSANVEGVGDKVAKFDEESLNLDILTPPIKCHTPSVYGQYRKFLLKNYDKIIKQNKLLSEKLNGLKSYEILNSFSFQELNDLYMSACILYPDIKNYADKNWFFSGSGSSFFRRKDWVKQ